MTTKITFCELHRKEICKYVVQICKKRKFTHETQKSNIKGHFRSVSIIMFYISRPQDLRKQENNTVKEYTLSLHYHYITGTFNKKV